jgi:S-DNA-T family DNA segregation ATPase FtsK/SpoIIIE
MFRLEVHEAGDAVVSYALELGKAVSVGRHADNDVVLDDPSVSRSHCLIYVTEGGVEIEDLGSTNGVRVEERRIKGRVEVRAGTTLTIGKLRCRLCRFEAAASPDETTVQNRTARKIRGESS